jgi:benzil reductase ((S)-benzoin forming)
MSAFVCITGASSGIGLALAQSVPFDSCTLMTVSRRPAPVGEWIEADLGDAGTWPRVTARLADALNAGRYEQAVLAHFAGVGSPHASTADAKLPEYISAVLLNSGAGLVLGKAFISSCRAAGVPATVVLCSSPGASSPMSGMSHYGAGKLGMEYWVRAVAAEHAARDGIRALAVVPFAVDTAMVRDVIKQTVGAPPVAALLRDAAARGELASAEATAAEIWDLVTDGGRSGAVVPVGAVPPGMRGAIDGGSSAVGPLGELLAAPDA